MTTKRTLLVAVLACPGIAQASDPFEGCVALEAGITTRLECGHVVLTVVEGDETHLPSRLGAHLNRQREQTQGELENQQTALQSSQGLLPAMRTELTPKGSIAPTESWLTAAAPSPLGSLLLSCHAPAISPETVGRCDDLVRRVANYGLPEHLRGLVSSQGGDWAAVEAKVGRALPSVVGCDTQIRNSSVVHLCESGVLAVALIPRSGGEVWQQRFLDGVLGGLPADLVVGEEDSVPCQVAGEETTCRRVHVADGNGEPGWVISAVAQGAHSNFTAVCTYPDLGFALPLYCRSLFGDVPPAPAADESSSRRRKSGRRDAR